MKRNVPFIILTLKNQEGPTKIKGIMEKITIGISLKICAIFRADHQ